MEELKAIPKRFWEDRKWGFDHYQELVDKYPDQWVAIVDKEVVSAGNLGEAEAEAKRKTGKKHIPVIFVERGSHIYKP